MQNDEFSLNASAYAENDTLWYMDQCREQRQLLSTLWGRVEGLEGDRRRAIYRADRVQKQLDTMCDLAEMISATVFDLDKPSEERVADVKDVLYASGFGPKEDDDEG